MSSATDHDERAARETERAYLDPQIARQRERVVDLLAPGPGQTVLDVGCGPGLLARLLAEAVGDDGAVIGVDTSRPMLNLARQRCAGLRQVAVIEADAAHLPLGAGGMDAAACTQVLLYLQEPRAVLAALNRTLRPGGRAVIVETDWQSAVLAHADQRLTQAMFDAWDRSVPSPRLPLALLPLLDAAGFGVASVDALPLVYTHYDEASFPGNMVAQCLRSAARVGVADAPARNRWLADIEDRAAQGTFFFCVNRFIYLAERA